MAKSLIIKGVASMAAGVTNPILSRDGLINAGSEFLIDAMRLGCWDPATDTVADGATVRNLVSGAPSATLKVPVAGDIIFSAADKGFKLKASVGLGRMQLGTGLQYYQSNMAHDRLISTMVKYPAVDPTGHIGLLISKNTLTSYSGVGPWMAYRYIANYLFARWDNKTSGSPTGVAAAGAPNGLAQVAFGRVGANLLYGKNGVVIGSVALDTPDLTANSTPLNWGSGGAASQYACPSLVLNRVYGEDLTLSGRTFADVIAQDYAENFARFA